MSQRESFPYSDGLSDEPKAQPCLEKYKDRDFLCRWGQGCIFAPLEGRLSLMLPQVALDSLAQPKWNILEKIKIKCGYFDVQGR